MKKTLLILDDDPEYVQDIKTNIEALEKEFFEKLDTTVCSFNVITSSTIKEAFDIINSQNVDIFAIDLELKDDERGDVAFDELFFKGKAIPAIVVSGVIMSQKVLKELKSKGIAKIVTKGKGDGTESERIAKAACTVLDSPSMRILQIRKHVAFTKVSNNTILHNRAAKTVDEWLVIVVKGTLEPQDENVILQKIATECIHEYRIMHDHESGFARS